MPLNLNTPNLLSIFRIAVIPAMALLFYIPGAVAAWFNLFLFVLAGLSDFLDGLIARRTGQTSILGKFLDSTSDKMIVGAVLLLLVGFGRLDGIWIIPALVVFLREILIAGMREFLALYNIIVPISRLGKWKLTLQMFSLGWLVVGDYGDLLVPHTMAIGKFLFLLAAVITVVSGWDYMKTGLETIRRLDAEKKPLSVYP
jgi:cardiolipin synthase (CMP-forming)